MSEKDLRKQVLELEKSLKGETDLNVVLEIWGKLYFLGRQLLNITKEGVLDECCL